MRTAVTALTVAGMLAVTYATQLSAQVQVGQSRYREANSRLMPQSNRVVFMGDSITEVWANQGDFAKRIEFVGRGIGGQTAQQMVVRFQADVIGLRPAVVHIMGGTNDLAENTGPESDEEIEDAITSMVEIARSN